MGRMRCVCVMVAFGGLAAGTGCAVVSDAETCGEGKCGVLDEIYDALCTPTGCPDNAASLGDGRVFHDLDLSGTHANAGGVRIEHISGPDGSDPYELQVHGDEMIGRDSFGVERSNLELKGTTLHLASATGHEYQVIIDDIERIHSWGREGVAPRSTYAYELTVLRVGIPDRYPLCKGEEFKSDPYWDSIRTKALIFAGDRLDPLSKTAGVREPEERSWINLACAGTATAKMHLLRHTVSGSVDGVSTDISQRQAMLKMLTADYCGTGKSYTQDGQPLYYGDNNPARYSNVVKGAEVEAIWTAEGAACLDRPRLFAREEVHCAEKVPTCTDEMIANWQASGYVLSAHRSP